MLKVVANSSGQCLAIKMVGTNRRTRRAVLRNVRIENCDGGLSAELIHKVLELICLVLFAPDFGGEDFDSVDNIVVHAWRLIHRAPHVNGDSKKYGLDLLEA